jgi:hypothetical protein
MDSDSRSRRPSGSGRRAEEADEAAEDTAIRCLSKDERAKLSIDSWEPSLLRRLLRAANRLPGGNTEGGSGG